VVDYEIKGSEMQFVEVELDPGEAAVGEAGSLFFMDAGITMDTVFGDGSGGGGGGFFGKLLGAGKRLVTGESLFTTVYTNHASSKQRVAFGAPYPGKILPMELARLGGTLICQKDSPSCAPRAVSRSASRCSRSCRSASSAARASSCRSSRATGSPSCMPAARWSSASCRPARR
jgi:uncharacterized protein (AIM24 family)